MLLHTVNGRRCGSERRGRSEEFDGIVDFSSKCFQHRTGMSYPFVLTFFDLVDVVFSWLAVRLKPKNPKKSNPKIEQKIRQNIHKSLFTFLMLSYSVLIMPHYALRIRRCSAPTDSQHFWRRHDQRLRLL